MGTIVDQQGFQVNVANRVARVLLDSPPLNILTARLQMRLAAAIAELGVHGDVNVLVLQSAVPGTFSAGADVNEHLGPENLRALLDSATELTAGLLCCPVPTLAAVDGPCLGGAFELMLACDQWLISDRAQLGLTEITLGCYPPAALVLAPQKLPAPLASEMILSGRVLEAAEFAGRAGVLCVPRAGFPAALDTACATFANLPRGALCEATRLLRAGAAERFQAAMGGINTAYLERLAGLGDTIEGVKAFLAKRNPGWDHQSVV